MTVTLFSRELPWIKVKPVTPVLQTEMQPRYFHTNFSNCVSVTDSISQVKKKPTQTSSSIPKKKIYWSDNSSSKDSSDDSSSEEEISHQLEKQVTDQKQRITSEPPEIQSLPQIAAISSKKRLLTDKQAKSRKQAR